MISTSMQPVAPSADAELVSASLAGNRDAFSQIVSRYQTLVSSLAYSATGSLSQSEDLAQETFIAAWQHLADLREPAKLRAWLCGITRNLIHNSLRSRGREPTHQAEPLEQIGESHSVEPLPVERVIRREEAEILWRSLERIPETYRVPLVLFYREHQCVEAVARQLDLSEEATRQRLSRGRKLLEDEVLAFVQVALERTAPGKTFTLSVVSALPIAVTSAKAASVGAVVAKGGAGVKSAFTLGALGGLLGILGAVLFSWKTAVDDTKSPRERRLMVRMGWIQIGILVLSLVIGWYWVPRLSAQPLAMGIVVALVVLANIIGGVMITDYLNRHRARISMEEGTLTDWAWTGPGQEHDRKVLRKVARLMVPIVLLFAIGTFGLPWKTHPGRSAVVVAGEILVVLWGFRRFQRLLTFQVQPQVPSSRLRSFLRHPVVMLPMVLFGSALLASLLPFFLNPGTAKPQLSQLPWLRNLGVPLIVAMVLYAVFAAVFLWKRKLLNPSAVILEKAYAPLLEQLHLSPEQAARLKDLMHKKTAAIAGKAASLMFRKRDAAQRTELAAQLRAEADQYDAQLRECLGEGNYAALQRYDKTIPDRTMVNLFCTQSMRTPGALSADQQEELVQALSHARSEFPWTTELSRRHQVYGDYAQLFTQDNLGTYAREEEEFDRQFLGRAGQILSPEQLAAFEAFQARQRQSQVNGFKFAAKMLRVG